MCSTQKNRIKRLFLTIAALLIFGMAVFSSLPANAQGLFWPPDLRSISSVPVPSYPYDFLSPLIGNRWATGNSLLPSASLMGGLLPLAPAPVRSAHAYINAATTIYLPPSAVSNLMVVIKPDGTDPIKLTSLIAPVTVFVYPTGYVPTVVAPVTTVVPATTIPTTTVAPPVATIPPATTVAPAAISGGLWPIAPQAFRPILPPPLPIWSPFPYWH